VPKAVISFFKKKRNSKFSIEVYNPEYMLNITFHRCFLILLPLCFLAEQAVAQTTFVREKRDYVWPLGWRTPPGYTAQGGDLNFNYDPPLIEPQARVLGWEASSTAISTPEGELLFYSNNMAIHNWNHQLIEDGDSINFNSYWQVWNDNGYVHPQHCLALPKSGDSYYLFHSELERYPQIEGWTNIESEFFRYSTIDMLANNGLGRVLEKNKILISQDTIDTGKVTATRHANGRDWWIAIGEYDSNKLYRFLATPDSVYSLTPQFVGGSITSGLGQGQFSPDGTKYAKLNLRYIPVDSSRYIDIYDFDRCTGTFSNPIQVTYLEDNLSLTGGLTFSPNSRFIYITSFSNLYQYDLWAEDISASQVLIPRPPPDGIAYFLGGIGPDDKVYLSTQGTHQFMHRINRPNLPGLACDYDHAGLSLGFYNFSTLPNFPEYGLGPLDNSPCDTLGIDNPFPIARFEYLAYSPTDFTFGFFEGSDFAYDWSWDFGDGSAGSTVRHPEHQYLYPGTYEVCLTASNATGSHTVCDSVTVGPVVGVEELAGELDFAVAPNPMPAYMSSIRLQSTRLTPGNYRFALYDMYGRRCYVQELQWWAGSKGQTLLLPPLAAGVYAYQLLNAGDQLVARGKWIKG
jgi:hypothetical protein